ncbi:MAG: trigger factor [Clostridia bacterium]|nr:trigger factor [Clostridia bacterium]
MKYTINKQDITCEIAFNVTAEEWEKHMETAYNKNRGKFAVAGFRKGHAPRKVLEGVYGEGFLYEDALDECFNEYYTQVLNENADIETVAHPELKDFKVNEDKSAEIIAVVPIKPVVKLGAYTGLTVKEANRKVEDAAVERELDGLKEKYVRSLNVDDRAVQQGDEITLDFSGSVDGVKFDGGTATDYKLSVGSNTFIPGFEEQLIGAKIGEDIDVKVKFPEDYHSEELKGKDSVFACKVKKIEVKEYPELNDDFVKDISEFNTMDEYKADLKEKLQQDLNAQADREEENALVELIVKEAEVPESKYLIEDQMNEFVEEFKSRLAQQGLKMEDYLKYFSQTAEQYREQYRDQAKQTVKSQLVIDAIIRKEDLKATKEELDGKIKEYAEQVHKTEEELKKTLSPQALEYFARQIVIQKFFDYIKANNTVSADVKDVAEQADESNTEAQTDKAGDL